MTINQCFVIDTNTIISAILLPQSKPEQVIFEVRRHGIFLASLATISELNDVVKRKKFNKYLPEEDRLNFVEDLIKDAEIVEITVTITDCRDPKDNKFLELAVSGHADCIISGDDDLLTLHPFLERYSES